LLIYRDIRVAMTRENRKRLKIFAFDECAAHISRPQLAAFLKRILKTFQKLNCLLLMLTQTPDDLGALRTFVMESCSTFAFFYSPGMVKSLKENFDWDDHRIEVFQSLLPREFLYHEEGQKDLWKKLKLTVDPLRYWLYTTRPDEVDLREKTIAQQGDLVTGLQHLAATATVGG
jgi:type IV secretory pathway VirB4 component